MGEGSWKVNKGHIMRLLDFLFRAVGDIVVFKEEKFMETRLVQSLIF